MRPLPTFLGIGTAKGGTTWMYECLAEHPEVYMSPLKEVEFFSRRYDRGFDWYGSYFREVGDAKAVGEVSPMYMLEPEAASRIHAWDPDVKLVAVLRNPIERAYSYYCMELRAARMSEDVDAEHHGGSRLVREGLYHARLEPFLALFPREQLKILLFDDLKASPEAFLRELYGFVGVDSSFRPALLHRPYHTRKSRPRFQRLFNLAVRASQGIGKTRVGRRAIDGLRKRGTVDLFHRVNRGPAFPTLSDGKRRELAETFRPDVEALERLLDRDLSHWLAVGDGSGA